MLALLGALTFAGGDEIPKPPCEPGAVQTGWLQRLPDGAPGEDRTAAFREAYALAASSSDMKSRLPAEAATYRYLQVDGVFGRETSGYFRWPTRRMTAAGLTVERVPVNPDASLAVTAAAIRDAILAEDAPVVLTGQGQGGVAALDALATWPELESHVRLVLALQAPYAGSALADEVYRCEQAHDALGGYAPSLLGSYGAELTFEAREKVASPNRLPSVPIVALATSQTVDPHDLLYPTTQYLALRGIASDGLVAPIDALIPWADYVRLDDMAHGEPMLGTDPDSPWRADAVIEALIEVGLTRPAG